MNSRALMLAAALGALLADKPGGIARVPSTSRAGRKMVRAKGAHETHGMPPALTTEQSVWNAQVEAKRKAKGKP